MVIAVVNNKGGVGKTTTSVNLAGALAGQKRQAPSRRRGRVLLVDLDSQASASLWCGVPRQRLLPSIASCLLQEYPLDKAIRKTTIADVDLLTGSVELANTDLVLCNRAGREVALRKLLQRVKTAYENIVLDCPPGISLLTINAILAADNLLVPVVPRQLSIHALESCIESIERVRTRLNGTCRLLGIVLVMQSVDRADVDGARRLRREHGDRLLKTTIPCSTMCDEAFVSHTTVMTLAPRTPIARAFARLASEVVARAAQPDS